MKIATVFILLCAFPVFGQSTKSKSTGSSQTISAKPLTPRDKLKKAIQVSQKQERISVTIESTIQGKNFLAIAEYLAPDRYSSKESRDGIPLKEGIEISGQRYQKKNGQWVRVRKDPFPLRDQFFDFLFPQLYSRKGDAIRIKSVSVKELDETTSDRRSYFRYEYSIAYSEFDWLDSAIAFVNKSTGLLERLEATNQGMFGLVKSIAKYNYEKDVTISAPKDFFVKDWID